MKILIANKFYYSRGGDCIVAMSTAHLLREAGHEVRIFAMKYPENIELPESESFASEVSFSGSAKEKLRAAARLLGRGDIRKTFGRVLDEWQPDVVHLHNIHSYLSPALVEEARRRGIRTLWTMHDYKLICPAYSCRRPDGSICEECIGGSLKVVANKCMKNSRLQSLMADIEARTWNRRRLEQATDMFIAPSRFLANKMMEAGFSPAKITTICNFVDPEKMEILSQQPSDGSRSGFCYIGRLSEEKGVATMLQAADAAGVELRIAGGGPLLEPLRKQYAGNKKITFLGHLDARGVAELLASSEASIIPSECYENNPLGVIESLCAGTPVIGAEIGGIPELLTADNGITFTSGNAEELSAILSSFPKRHPFDHRAIAASARDAFSAATHLRLLTSLFPQL